MLIKSTGECVSLIANDGCRVFEVLHPKNDGLDLPYSFAVAEVAPGEMSYRHRLRQTEVYYVIDGSGLMHVGDDSSVMHPGDAVVIPPDAVQWIENLTDAPLRFIAVVSPPWSADDDERL